ASCRRFDGQLGPQHRVLKRNGQVDMQVAAFDTVARMRAETDFHEGIARAARALLALALQSYRLAVLDKGGQLDRDLAAIREHGGHSGSGGRFLDAYVEPHIDVAAGRSRARAHTRTLCAALGKGVAEQLRKNV